MTPKITTPIIGLEWEKKMKDKNEDMKFIKDQIDSWVIEIDHSNMTEGSMNGNDLETFLKLMRQYGHLANLKEDYQQKFFKIAKYYADNYSFGALAKSFAND